MHLCMLQLVPLLQDYKTPCIPDQTTPCPKYALLLNMSINLGHSHFI